MIIIKANIVTLSKFFLHFILIDFYKANVSVKKIVNFLWSKIFWFLAGVPKYYTFICYSDTCFLSLWTCFYFTTILITVILTFREGILSTCIAFECKIYYNKVRFIFIINILGCKSKESVMRKPSLCQNSCGHLFECYILSGKASQADFFGNVTFE